MQLQLFTTKDSKNVINKKLINESDLSITLKRNENIKKLDIIISRQNYNKNFNYAVIPYLSASYFINGYDIINNSHVTLHLEIDLLETYKNDILNSPAQITEKSSPSYISSSLPVDSRTETTKYTSDVTIPDTHSFILITVGG